MDVRGQLMEELKKIYNDKDFVCGTSSILGYESTRKSMLDFIQTAKSRGDDITSDNVLLLAMRLRDEEDSRREIRQRKKRVKAAVF